MGEKVLCQGCLAAISLVTGAVNALAKLSETLVKVLGIVAGAASIGAETYSSWAHPFFVGAT